MDRRIGSYEHTFFLISSSRRNSASCSWKYRVTFFLLLSSTASAADTSCCDPESSAEMGSAGDGASRLSVGWSGDAVVVFMIGVICKVRVQWEGIIGNGMSETNCQRDLGTTALLYICFTACLPAYLQ